MAGLVYVGILWSVQNQIVVFIVFSLFNLCFVGFGDFFGRCRRRRGGLAEIIEKLPGNLQSQIPRLVDILPRLAIFSRDVISGRTFTIGPGILRIWPEVKPPGNNIPVTCLLRTYTTLWSCL